MEDELLKDYNTEQKRFIYYMYNHYVFSVNYEQHNNLYEVSSRIIDRIFKGKRYKERIGVLIDDGIIETDNWYIEGGKCKSYKLNDEFYLKMIERKDISKKTLYSTKNKNRVFMTTPHKTRKIDENERRYDPIILDSISVMKGMIDYKSLLEFEDEINMFLNKVFEDRARQPGYYKELCSLLKQIDSVKTYLLFQGFNENEGTYNLFFKVSSNGRIFGNFQNKSRKIKKVLLDVYKNYDLSSSHPSILLGLLKENNLPYENFAKYVNDPVIKETLHKESGLGDVKDIKGSFLPILYGGANTSYKKNSFSKIIFNNMSFEIFDGDEVDKQKSFIKERVDKIIDVLKPFEDEIKCWIRFLQSDYIPAHTKTSKGEPYILNCLGRRIYLDKCKYKNGKQIPRNKDGSLKQKVLHKVSSHIINGIESHFIYDITKTTTELDQNTVIHNDFDGIVCTGLISEESKRLASERNGYIESTSFVEKEIDSEFDSFMKIGRDMMNK